MDTEVGYLSACVPTGAEGNGPFGRSASPGPCGLPPPCRGCEYKRGVNGRGRESLGGWCRVTQQFDVGMHHILREEWRPAVRAFREALWEDSKDGRAWSFLGMALAHLGQGAEAESALSRALALAPQDGEAWFHLGVARSLRGEWSQAVSAYRRAVAYLPEDLVAWHRLGVALAESGDGEGATASFERALVLSRETGRPLPGALPQVVERTADSHLAEAGEREDSREVESWLSLALSLLSLGDEEEAMAAYERAYTIDPDRARHSLFRPMLNLLTVAQGNPIEDDAPAPGPTDERRPRPELPFARPSSPGPRPEVG
jgi:tetratricopeptide (TPR) repeat protein